MSHAARLPGVRHPAPTSAGRVPRVGRARSSRVTSSTVAWQECSVDQESTGLES
jgi:hypothetical protein